MKNAIIALIALIVITGGTYLFFASGATEKEVAAVAVDDITAISKSWNGMELRRRSDPGLIKAMESQGQSPEELLGIYRALGRLKQPPACAVKATSTTMKGGEQHAAISYECSAEYEKAPAFISITLSKADSAKDWVIYYINIHSDIFAKPVE